MSFRLGDIARMPFGLAREQRIKKSGCEGKVKFPNDAAAIEQMDSLYAKRKAPPGSLNTYRCRWCRSYHVGHHWI